jgi:hypothetical protein
MKKKSQPGPAGFMSAVENKTKTPFAIENKAEAPKESKTKKPREPKVEAVAEAIVEPQVADAVEEVATEELPASEESISE